jgi:sulfatase modifying factor 1
MRRNLRTLLLVVASLGLAVTTRGRTAAAPSVAVEVETVQNAPDGSIRRGCQDQEQVEAAKKHRLWIVFGEVKAHAERGWEALTGRTHCGSGSFEKASSRLGRTLGIPYLILDLQTVPAASTAGGVRLETSLSIRKLSGFDDTGHPVYAHTTQKRTFHVPPGGDVVFPLLIASAREKEAFEAHEVLLRIRASILGREPAVAYGRISVTADVPGAEILLDGGFVGRTSELSPTVLRNVPAGKREVRVRDFSGRTAQKHVVVKRDKTVQVALRILPPSSPEAGNDLVRIGKNAQGYEEYWRRKDGALAVRIPAGEFVMGSPEGEGEPAERPQHRPYVSEFLIDKTEVTWRQFRRYAEATGTPLPPAPVWGALEDYAASNILWAEAKAFCEWVGGRLPTEAEWEKAARGTDGRRYPWGSQWELDHCNAWQGGPHRPESVGSYPNCVSPYGVLEMPGSTWEWCADWYDEHYYRESPSKDPQGPTSGTARVLRGGAWLNQATWLRPAYRHKTPPSSRNVLHGVRCVLDVPG